MIRAYRSEWVRLTRTALLGLAIMVAFSVLITVLVFVGPGRSSPGGSTQGGSFGGAAVRDLAQADGLVAGIQTAATFLGLVALTIAAISVARDFQLGTIRVLLVSEPRRLVFLGGKLLALGWFVVVAVAIGTAAAIVTAFLLARTQGIATSAWTSGSGAKEALTTFVNISLATLVWGLLGAALAMATRSSAVAITVGIGYLLIVENLIVLVWDHAAEWLPSGLLRAFTTGGTLGVPYARAAVLLALYGAVALALTLTTFVRRDITD